MVKNIPFYKPSLPSYEEIEPNFFEAYSKGWLAPGKYTERLEETFCKLLEVKHAIAFSNCSDGMMCLVGHLADLSGRNIVIVPDFTFAATWQAVEWNGLTTLVTDVNKEGMVDVKHLESMLRMYSSDIVCIMAVHMFGNPAPVKELQLLSERYDVPVCYDAAHAVGIKVDGNWFGNNGLAEVYSIGTTKPLSAGEGGILTTDDNNLAEAMRKAAMHGHKYGELDVEVKSLNGRIQEINSIIAYYGLNRLEEVIKERKNVAEFYNKEFPKFFSVGGKELEIRKAIAPKQNVDPSYKDYTLFIDVTEPGSISFRDRARLILTTRETIIQHLTDKGIGTKRYYYPNISKLSYFKRDPEKNVPCRNSQGELLSNGCISIPFFNGITADEQIYVLESLQEALASFEV